MSKTSASEGTTQPRRRFRFFRSLGIVTLVIVAIAAVMLAPFWIPILRDGDEGLIAAERSKRRLLASVGLPMPNTPGTGQLPQRLADHGLRSGAPIFIRIFKREFELEVWMQRDGLFHRFATYPMCVWSGKLGPKFREGDQQAPEGFYTVDASALNPNSQWYRSFNLGYPNAYDRAHNRTGSFLMVHGGCASVGCFAMTDAQMDDIWQLVTAALKGGQKRFQVQAFPFRMTNDQLAHYAGHPSYNFWKKLKIGHDLFESTLLPPRVHVCNDQYGFEAGGKASLGEALIEARCPQQTSVNSAK